MGSTTSTQSDARSSAEPMDVRDALSRLEDDRELLNAIVTIYLEDAPKLLEQIRRAVMGNDCRTLQRAAHSMKGLAVTLSACDVAATASRLEQMGSAGSLSDAAAFVVQLEARLGELETFARRFVKNSQ